jgi:DNA-binding transcriptional MerR regulator
MTGVKPRIARRWTMRIAELSEASDLPVATLKYYLREGLLHPGEARAVNQADYDESHVRRVRLIRALLELGNLQLAEIKRVLAAVDDESVPLHDALGIAQDAMVPGRDRDAIAYVRARADVDDFVARHGLSVRPEAHVRLMLADALVAVRSGGWDFDLREFDSRMRRVLADAASELSGIPTHDRVLGMEAAVIGTISYEVAVSALRRMALEHASAQRFASE